MFTLLSTLIVASTCIHFYLANALMDATGSKNHTVALLLLNLGANPNSADDRGRTCLMWAANLEDATLVQAYLQHGAKVNLRDSHGQTALTWAEYTQNKQVTYLLKRAGGLR